MQDLTNIAEPSPFGPDKRRTDIRNHWHCDRVSNVYCPACIDEHRDTFLLTDGDGRYHCPECQITWERDHLLQKMSEALVDMTERNRRVQEEIRYYTQKARDCLRDIDHEADKLQYARVGWR